MKGYLWILLSLAITVVPCTLRARPLLEFSGTEFPLRDTVYTFSFILSEHNSFMTMDMKSDLESGTLNIWLGGGGYEVIGNYTGEGSFRYDNVQFGPLNNRDEITARITATRAQGTWSVRLDEYSRSSISFSLFFSGLLIVIVSSLFIIVWKSKCRSSFRWFFFGSLAWLVGVALKFLFAYFLNTPILAGLENIFHTTGYLMTGSIYIGSLTGIFEIGATLALALMIRSLYADACRALGFGAGAGTTEALLIGLSQIGSFVIISSGAPGGAEILSGFVSASLNTPAFVLVAPAERLLVIPCHIASRIMVLYAVFRKKPSFFWAAFALMTAIDAVAGYSHLAGLVNTISMWWIELTLLPFAVASTIIILWCAKNWHPGEIRQTAITETRA